MHITQGEVVYSLRYITYQRGDMRIQGGSVWYIRGTQIILAILVILLSCWLFSFLPQNADLRPQEQPAAYLSNASGYILRYPGEIKELPKYLIFKLTVLSPTASLRKQSRGHPCRRRANIWNVLIEQRANLWDALPTLQVKRLP